MNNLARITLAALLIAVIPTIAHAGPGAIIYGCIYLPTPPIDQMTVNFTINATTEHCMTSSGTNASLQTSSAGISCTSMGYVEATASDSPFENTCGSDDSLWTLGYSIQGTGLTSSVLTSWPKGFLGIGHNFMNLVDPGTTSVCPGQPDGTTNLCNGATSIQWDSGSQGPLFIIFQAGS